ncbi:MAG: MFS family permease [Candidatus Azotimanducaceae bacterium]|jgi:MFS family permease
MLVVLGALLTGCVTGLAWTMAPSAGEAANLSPIEIGWMMNAIILGGVVCQYPLGYLADHLPRDYIVAGVATFCTLTSMSLFLVSFSPAAFIAAMFLLGGSSLTLYALCAAVADGLSAISKVEIADILLFCNGVGSVVSPFLVGFLAEHVNNAMFLVCGISMMVLAVVAVLSKNQPSADVIQLHLAHRHQVEWDEVG